MPPPPPPPPPGLDLQNLNPANLGDIAAGLGKVLSSLHQQAMDAVTTNANDLLGLFMQPDVRAAVLSASVSFTAVLLLMASSGFGIDGIGAGTLAAAFQSVRYGNLTPGGSLFAKLQSMGMLGTLLPALVGTAVVIASLVSAVVLALREGQE